MATVTQRPAANLSESSRKVRDPLQKLRFYIRSYVASEVAASLVISLALFFWLGLLVDYGSFLLGLDWVRDTPRGFRVLLPALGLLVTVYAVEFYRTGKPSSRRSHEAPWRESPLTANGESAYILLLVLSLLSSPLLAVAVLLFVKSQRTRLWIFAFTGGTSAIYSGGTLQLIFIGQVWWAFAFSVITTLQMMLLLPSLLMLLWVVRSERKRLQIFGSLAAGCVVLIGGVFLLGILGHYGWALALLGITCVLDMILLCVVLFLVGAALLLRITVFGLAVTSYLACWIAAGVYRDLEAIGTLECAAFVLTPLALFIAAAVIKRLRYDFADASLALVLEKRFPTLLGDRLITAVELADPKIAARYGYSEAMVELTIHEAADRVGRLHIGEVFNWNRLRLKVALALVFTLGIYAVVFGSLASIGAATDRSAGSQFTALNDAAAIWAERNVLLDNERWPTRSIVQLVNFPSSGELKKGKGSEGGKDLTRVDLQAHAFEYAFHDARVAECWRPLLLSDLTGDRAVRSLDILERLPFSWKEGGWTADHLKFMSQSEPAVKLLDASTQAGLKALLEEIDDLAEQPRMSRTLRKLIVPSEVTIRYKSEDGMTKTSATMQTRANNEYTAELNLKDSVSFYLTAEDFVSDTRKITLVPPPRVSKLQSIEERPAYLYQMHETEGHILPSVMASTAALLAAPGSPLVAASALPPERPYDDDRFFLGPRKQRGQPIAVNVGGELKPKIPVPATTNVVLKAETDKDLQGGSVKLDGKGAAALENIKPRETGTRTFEIVIPNVRGEMDFRLEFRDTDGALGMQELQIVIDEDSPPSVDQFKPEVVREVGGKFKVTPQAVIPFTFFVKDPKFGLAELDFVYTIKEAPTPGEQARRAMRVAGGAGLVLSGPEAPLSSYIYNLVMPGTLRGSEEVLEGRLPVAEFKARMENHRRFRDFLDRGTRTIPRRWADTEKELAEEISFSAPAKMLLSYNLPELRDLDKYLTDHDMRIDECFPLKGMDLSLIRRVDSTGLLVPLKARPLEIQRRYDLTVSLEARDTNVSRPQRGRHESQPIAFEIVSEIELLFEMNQEEQRLYDELNKASADLKRGFGQLQALRFDMAASPPPGRSISFDSFSVRTEDVQKIANESKRMTAKVTSDYEKVLREMRTNRIENTDAVRKTKDAIVIPLNKILVGDYRLREAGKDVAAGFTVAADGLNYLRKAVDNTSSNEADRLAASRREAEAAEKDLERLIKALDDVLLEMKGIVELGEILKGLRDIELKQLESLRKIEEKKRIEEENLFKGLGK